jgi:Zn-dependent protease
MASGITPEFLRSGLLFYILLIACLGLRAYAQAWAADRLGDPTPRDEGRLTLNLIPHMDLFGSVILPLISIFYLGPKLGSIAFFLAWTKPMPINDANFANPRRDYLLTQLGSMGMSVGLALLAAVAGGLAFQSAPKQVAEVVEALIRINAMLIVLDLLPLPPFPGGLLVRHLGFISEEMYHQLARWGGLIFLVAINIPVLRAVLGILIHTVATPFAAIFNSLAA